MNRGADAGVGTLTVEQALQQAIAHHRAGRLQDAERLYRAILQSQPNHPDANHNLGVLAVQMNQAAAGLPHFKAALEANPSLEQYWLSYIDALIQTGSIDTARQMLEHGRQRGLSGGGGEALAARLRGAAQAGQSEMNTLMALFTEGRYTEAVTLAQTMTERFPQHGFGWNVLGAILGLMGRSADALVPLQKAVALSPESAEAHSNLANALKELGQLDDAVASYRRAIEIKPDYAEAHSNLGNALRELGQLDEAVVSCRRALEINPDLAETHNNLGLVLQRLGQLDDAVTSCRRALEISPGFAEPHYNLGSALRELGRLDEAMASYRRALEIKPDLAEAHCNLGLALQDLGRLDEAMASYRRALEIKPDLVEALCNLGNAQREYGQLDEAVASYRRALEIKPDFAEAHSDLGTALQLLGQFDEAVASYRRALEIRPNSMKYASQFHLLLPVIPESSEAIASWRARYQTGVSILAGGDFDDDLENPEPFPSFILAYQNQNDKALKEALSHMFRKHVSSLNVAGHSAIDWRTPAVANRRIRVGFLSENLSAHTIGKLFQGLFSQLDRRLFEVVVIHAPKAKRDFIRQGIDSLADKVISLPPKLRDQQAAVIAEHLDVLFYPDIGMSPATYALSYSRLAPVQAVSWGHPDTTGLDSMDYFVSAASIEPPDADEHYAERLIRLNRMPCFYQAFEAPTKVFVRQELGLPEDGVLYCCPQNLIKFHPDFDPVLASIAEGDPEGHIIVIEGKYAPWTNLLKTRWAKTYPVLLERVIFLPLMPLDRFMTLMAHIDILLDPIHFGSGNSMYEAMVYGTPIVTWPGRFMRGRIVAGCYKQLGIKNPPIAERLEDYAKIALALGLDPERRHKLKNDLLAAAAKELFADMRAVREFEHFLLAAVNAEQRGEKLPIGWSPSCENSLSTNMLHNAMSAHTAAPS